MASDLDPAEIAVPAASLVGYAKFNGSDPGTPDPTDPVPLPDVIGRLVLEVGNLQDWDAKVVPHFNQDDTGFSLRLTAPDGAVYGCPLNCITPAPGPDA